MLWVIVMLLVILWLLGLIASIGGAAVHLLLILALIVFIFQLFNRRAAGL